MARPHHTTAARLHPVQIRSSKKELNITKILQVSEMNRARLADARAAVVDSTAGRREKNRLSALASRQKALDETESLARRVLQLESQLQNCKNRLSRYEAVDDREEEDEDEEEEEEELTEAEMGLQDCSSQTTDSAIVTMSSGGAGVGFTELEVNYADLLSDVDMSPFLEHQPEALLVY